MPQHAFIVTGDKVLHIANPAGAAFPYQATSQVLLPQVQVDPQRHESAETVIVVAQGTLEMMVNGAAALVGAGSHVRVPPGVWFAYRNPSDFPVRLLSRTAPVPPSGRHCRVTVQLTAA